MKILDIPQSGKRGLNVSQAGQFGQISRTLAILENPRTPAQMTVRDNLSRVAARWRTRTEPQRVEGMAAASAVQSTIVRGSKPVSQGAEVRKDFRILGACPAPADGAADITGLYTVRYGVPKAGTKVYVQVNQVVDGWESLPRTYSAIVPTAS